MITGSEAPKCAVCGRLLDDEAARLGDPYCSLRCLNADAGDAVL